MVAVLWLFVAFVYGQPDYGLFLTEEQCRTEHKRVADVMVADGMEDTDMISDCVAITVKEPPVWL